MVVNHAGQANGSRGNRAVIYVRESLDTWGDARAVERFEEQCRRLCAARDLSVIRVLRDNDVRASSRNKGAGYAEVLRMLAGRETDYVVIPVVDRFFRNLRDLEDVIDICLEAGAALVAASGEIDLSHDQGRLVARLLTSVAKAETERKGARHRDANEQAARAGKRRTGTPRPFGYAEDHVTAHQAEAPAVAEACRVLLGGGTLSGVMREWARLGLRPPQAETKRATKGWSRNSVRTILLNPRIAGLSAYRGEIVGVGEWEPLVGEETWRAVRAILEDPARKPPRGVRTLLGGLACCPCGNVVTGMPSHTGHHIYRCAPATRNRAYRGGHVARQAAVVEDFIERTVIARLSRADAADLVAAPERGVDVAGLREEAAAIRANLEEMAADRAVGLLTRAQMLAATQRGNARLEEIAAELADAARESVLAPLLGAESAAAVWESLDLARKRAVIKTLMTITLRSPGRGARRAFDPATVQVTWRQDEPDEEPQAQVG
ncbi:MAG TPA: recombinase family protein [Streptosporangiaceae bacterium]|nr:recombinase family protein [Streptosporangiaceae bacterium]